MKLLGSASQKLNPPLRLHLSCESLESWNFRSFHSFFSDSFSIFNEANPLTRPPTICDRFHLKSVREMCC